MGIELTAAFPETWSSGQNRRNAPWTGGDQVMLLDK